LLRRSNGYSKQPVELFAQEIISVNVVGGIAANGQVFAKAGK
jgi:hypothetical protein